MEGNSGDSQFDSYLGGKERVPSGINLSEFIKHRMEEVMMLTEALEDSPFRGQAFQRLPKHMRRRQMSHYIKRLPRRLQRSCLMSLKDGPPMPTKRPSRKYRRRPGNLLLEYNRRQKTSVWLETHIWHAKRFHMTTKWGYKIPEKPVNKSFKACYVAISEHCMLVDMSYYNCIELQGPESELLEGLKQCTSAACGLTFGAKTYLSGAREGCLTLFQPNSYPYNAIGTVTFMWEPVISGNESRKIWIWVHPLMHGEVINCFRLLFHLFEVKSSKEEITVENECSNEKTKWKKGDRRSRKKIEEVKLQPRNIPFVRTPKYSNERQSVTMTLLKDTLNRFQLTGPLSQAIISKAFTVASVGKRDSDVEYLGVKAKKRKIDDSQIKKEKNWWEDYYNNENYSDWFDEKKFKQLLEYSRPSDMPLNMILGIVIEDPRLRIPAKRQKAESRIEDARQMADIPPGSSHSPIWIPEVRDEVSAKKLTTQQINEARSKNIVPGFDANDVIPDEMQSRIPILLVQRPGNTDPRIGKSGLGSGWDVIAPAGFGMPIWLSLVFLGARTGGLRQTHLLRLECNHLRGYPPPDSAAGEMENLRNFQNLKNRYFKLPPNKRANFIKLGIVSPFYPPWNLLVRDWVSIARSETEKSGSDEVKFFVLRDSNKLRALSEVVNKFTKRTADYSEFLKSDSNCLIPVKIECSGKGKPQHMALICVPEDRDLKDLRSPGPMEPSHLDENEKTRKTLKAEHSKLLKSLKRKRRKERGKLKEEFANDFPGKLKWKDILKTNFAPSEPHSKEYNAEMERLWLPDPENLEKVADTSTRKILGFVLHGEFGYSRSRGIGLGYVTLTGLMQVFDVCKRNKSKVVVLVRNRNQVQYRFGHLGIPIE